MFVSRTTFTPSTDHVLRGIVELIAARLVEVLTDALVHRAPREVRAEVVRVGLAQEDPVQRRIGVYVHTDDPDDLSEDPSWSDSHLNPGERWALGLMDIGSGFRWSRKFIVEARCYFISTKESRDVARQQANWVADAAHRALMDAQGLGLTDSFGEHAIYMSVYKVDRQESGGPPNSHIWRIRLYVKAFTELSVEGS